jgi:hypothetical protein
MIDVEPMLNTMRSLTVEQLMNMLTEVLESEGVSKDDFVYINGMNLGGARTIGTICSPSIQVTNVSTEPTLFMTFGKETKL